MIRLSVIIPTYNRAELVCRAVQSVLSQLTDDAVEILVVDDGSTDGTIAVLQKRFAEPIQQRRLILLQHLHVGDPATMRNFAARNARGEFLALLDSDDQWLPGRVERLLAVLDSVDLVLCPEGADLSVPGRIGGDWLQAYLGLNYGVASSIVVRRSLYDEVGAFPELYYGPKRRWLRGWEDYEFILRCLLILDKRGQLDRFRAMDLRQDVALDQATGGVGRVKVREQMWRELMTLLRVMSAVPDRAWSLWSRRVLGAMKAVVLGG